MEGAEDPQAINLRLGSRTRNCCAASRALRPYSRDVIVPICQGPSISLPRHQYLTLCGCAKPCDLRNSLHFVPRSTLQYSTKATCSATVPVPKFPPRSGSVPTNFAHWMNSFVPNWLGSSVFQARSSTVGRWLFGPTPSSQLYPETKLPPG